METVRWYQKEPLHRHELEKLMEENGFREIYEISPCKPNQSKHVKIGDKIEVLMNNGLRGYYTITAMRDASRFHVVGRDETGINEKGEEFALDSSMCWCYDVAYKVLEKFAWE